MLVAHPRLALTLSVAALFALFDLFSLRTLDMDFGWHLQAGNYIRAHGIPTHDIFTYSARQFSWIDHEWGNDVVVSWLYSLGGYPLLAALYAALWSGGLVIAGARARFGVLLLAAFAMFPYAGIRPVAWTVLFLAVTLRLLHSKKRWVVWLLPLLFVPWANLHAGFVSALALIVYIGWYERRPALFGVFALSTLATFINAYGPRLYVEIARTLFDPKLHSQVGEWHSFVFQFSALLFIAIWGAGGVLMEKRTLKIWLRPSIPLLLAAMSATRNTPLFIVAAVQESSRYIDGIAARVRASKPVPGLGLIKVGAAVVAFGVLLLLAWQTFWPLNANRLAVYPQAAVTYLRANGCEGGNMFNDYNYGGYLIWKLPQQPVYIDGRMPSWKAPDGQKYMTKYYNLLGHPAEYRALFARYDIHCTLLQHGPLNISLIARLLRDQWRPIINNKTYILLLAPDGSKS
jgi:hypothetical protein